MNRTNLVQLQILIVFIFVAIAGCIQEQKSEQISITISIYDSENLIQEKQINTTSNKTLLEILKENNLKIEYEQTSFGPFLKTIEGITPSEDEYIAIYLNKKYASEGIGTLKPENMDKIEFHIEKIDPNFGK